MEEKLSKTHARWGIFSWFQFVSCLFLFHDQIEKNWTKRNRTNLIGFKKYIIYSEPNTVFTF